MLKIINRNLWNVLHYFALSIIFMFYESVLILARGTDKIWLYAMLFAAGIGLCISSILALLPKLIRQITTACVILITAILFIIEILVKNSFQQYMPLSAIGAGAGGIMGHYTEQLFSAIFSGISIILLMILPFLIYAAIQMLIKPSFKLSLSTRVLQLVLGMFLFTTSLLFLQTSNISEVYRSGYNFNTATQSFGLLTSLRLDIQYRIFPPADANSFVMAPTAETSSESTAEESEEVEEEILIESSSILADSVPEEIMEEPEIPAEPEYNVLDIAFDSLIASTSDETIRSMHEYVKNLPPSQKNNYTGQFAGKNLIMICAEALSGFAISEELTPTLYRICNNGIRMNNFYQPSWGGSTSTGEFSFLTGLIPSYSEETILKTQGHNLYYTTGNAMQRLGYHTYAFHSGHYQYYSRHLTHENLGYSQFIATGQGMEEITGGSYSSDTTTFDKTLDLYIDQQPFTAYYMSLSGHSNYQSGSPLVAKYLDRVNEVFGDRYKATTKYYLCYQMELDRALELMIQKLEAAGIADNTVIALVPDHYPYGLENSKTFGNSEDYLADLYGYKYTNWWNLDKSCAAIWSTCMEKQFGEPGGVSPTEINTVTYSIDIIPTLLNLFGIEFDSRLLPGRDILAPDVEPLVVWENYSWLSDTIYHDSGSGNNYLTDGSGNLAGSDQQEYIDRLSAIAKNKIVYSSRVINNDYFGILFGPDEVK